MEVRVEEVLEERGKSYGTYASGVVFRTEFLDSIEKRKGKNLNNEEQVIWNDIAMKLSRLAFDIKHDDSWTDLQGYAKIIQGMLNERKN